MLLAGAKKGNGNGAATQRERKRHTEKKRNRKENICGGEEILSSLTHNVQAVGVQEHLCLSLCVW